jgi:hypothetical protein
VLFFLNRVDYSQKLSQNQLEITCHPQKLGAGEDVTVTPQMPE